MSELRKKILDESNRVVIKIGSSILVDPNQGGVNIRYIASLAASIERLMPKKEVVVVTSGAVGTGMAKLGYAKKPDVIPEKQACAAVGQIELMHVYSEEFAKCNMVVGQVLLSAEDFRCRDRYKNLQNMIKVMLAKKIVPIINENDSIATAEIKVGDNDKLSSDVALFLDADLLLIFTDEDGLFDANPKTNSNARLIQFVPEINAEIMALAGKPSVTGSAVSTGGMYSKLKSIRAVLKSGCNAFLANGKRVLPHQVFYENAPGTLFTGCSKKLNSRQRWLSFISTPRGNVIIDAGGCKALREKHSSLLPVGVVAVEKHFDQGDLVNVLDELGTLVARGITKYDSETLKLVLRKKTPEVRSLLGTAVSDEVIHKNDLVVM